MLMSINFFSMYLHLSSYILNLQSDDYLSFVAWYDISYKSLPVKCIILINNFVGVSGAHDRIELVDAVTLRCLTFCAIKE